MGGVVAGAGESLVTRLPAEATDALIVDTVFLVVSCVVAGKAEWFFGCGIANGEMVKFLEEGKSIETMEGVYEVDLLLVYDGVCGSDVFEMVICLVGLVQGEVGAAELAVGKDGDVQLFIV